MSSHVLSVATALSIDFGGVVSRGILRLHGVQRHHVSKEVSQARWTLHGRQTVATHTRPLSREEEQWRAVWESGPKVAALDGVSALIAAGLKGYDEQCVHVSVVHTARVAQTVGVKVHKIARRLPGEVISAGVPRVRVPTAAVRAAQWAVSDRQAALILVMTVQQRLATGEQLGLAHDQSRGRRRRAFVKGVISDICGGVQALGELDFAKTCRRRGLPEPDRQVVRTSSSGRVYLDVRWDSGVVAEIDGVQHRQGLAVTDDNLRQNDVAIESDLVLRFDLVGLRLRADTVMAQLARALASRG